jgi:hypothetical protein
MSTNSIVSITTPDFDKREVLYRKMKLSYLFPAGRKEKIISLLPVRLRMPALALWKRVKSVTARSKGTSGKVKKGP